MTLALAEKIRVTVERGLLKKADAYAKASGISRSELIARGLRAVMAGKRANKRAKCA